jgi:hypothetical protein
MTKRTYYDPEHGEIPNCPECKRPLIHVRLFNEEIFGLKNNPYIGWICQNPRCKGWFCDVCDSWHPYGTMCAVAEVRNSRREIPDWVTIDPNWKHREN